MSGTFSKLIRFISVICSAALLMTTVPITVSAEKISDKAVSVSSEMSKCEITYGNSPIQGEIEEMREESVKCFRCEDGTILATLYDQPIHYKENGNWKEINNTLKQVSVSGNLAYYTNTANNFRVHLPSKMNSSTPAYVTKDGYTLKWALQTNMVSIAKVQHPPVEAKATTSLCTSGLKNASGTTVEAIPSINKKWVYLEKQTSTLSYPRVSAHTNLQYDISGNTVKESLILSRIPTQRSYTFTIQAAGLKAQLKDDQSVYFYTSNEEKPVFVIAAPYMFDNSHEISQDIDVTLDSASNGGYRYTITPSRTWLEDPKRQYPVTVDPTIQTDIAPTSIDATQAYTRYPTKNYGGADILYAGAMKDNNGHMQEYRSFVRLNMPSSLPNTRYRVVLAQLYMRNYQYWNLHANQTQINLHKITSSWDENTLTWNNMPSYDTTISDYTIGQSGAGVCSFDITALADGWINGTESNNGVLLKRNPGSTSKNDNVCWYSENVSSAYAGGRPTALIAYRECSGIEDYWTYSTLSVGHGATASVNHATGALTAILPDCGVTGNRLPVALSHVYNPSNSIASVYGGKWRLNYQMSIASVSIANNTNCNWKYTDGDGTVHYFVTGTDGSIKDEDGLGLTLTINNSSTAERYTLTDKNKNRMTFNNFGNLHYIYDTNNNKIEIIYEGSGTSQRISQIKDGAGRTYTFTYTNGVLSSIKDPANRIVQFTYSNGSLSKVLYPGNRATNITYSGDKIACITSNGERLEVHYDAATLSRVNAMSLYSAGSTLAKEWLTFDYKFNATTVKDASCTAVDASIPVTYQFNEYLQTVCVVSHNDGRAQSFKYGKPGGESTGNENKIIMSSDTHRSVVNHMQNNRVDSNFEIDGSYYRAVAPGQTGIVTWDSSRGHTAKGSIKVSRTAISTSTNPFIYGQQNYTTPSSGYYAVSAFANTNGVTLSQGPGAILRLERWRNGTHISSVQCCTSYTPQNEWQRLGTTLYCDAGDTLKILLGTNGFETMGTMWFDDVQFEMLTEAINTHNLLDNTDFGNGKNGWTVSGGNWSVVTDNSSDRPNNASHVLKVTGNASQKQSFSQTALVTNGRKGDAFSLGAWAKGKSAAFVKNESGEVNRTFGIRLKFANKDGTTTQRRINFNTAYSGWQFISGEAVATKDYSSVTMSIEYSYNVNTPLFALPYLYKDNYGQSYTYDKNGNVVSAADQMKNQEGYAYNNNQLNRITMPTGSELLMSSNADTNNLISVMSTDGQRYEYTYDAYGNPTQTMVGVDTFAKTLEAGKTYYLRNACTGNAFDCTNLEVNALYRNWRWISASTHQPLTLEATNENDVFKMSPYQYPSLKVDVKGNTSNSGALIQIYSDNSNACQRFKFKRNENGTFTILTKASNYTKCIDAQPGDVVDASSGVLLKQEPVVDGDAGQQWYFIEYSQSITDDIYFKSTTTYAPGGNYVDKVTDQLNHTTDYNYNRLNGNLDRVTDAAGRITQYGYDPSGMLTKSVMVRYSDTILGQVFYDYNQDRLSKIEFGGQQYRFIYDDMQRKSEVHIGMPNNSICLAKYNYSSGQGLLSSMQYADGTTVKYEYDNLGRQIKRWHDTNVFHENGVETVYNDRGLIGMIKDFTTNSRTRFWYDLAGRPVYVARDCNAAADSGNFLGEIYYQYETGKDRLEKEKVKTKVHSTENTYSYGNPELGQMPDSLYQIKTDNRVEISYQYDKLGRKTYRTLNVPNVSTHYTYQNADNNQTSAQLVQAESSLGSFMYVYDSVGNICWIITDGTTQDTFRYDLLNQLSYACVSGTTYNYQYDTRGNILEAQEGNNTHTYVYGNPIWKDQLTGYDGQTITYDACGNPLSYLRGMQFTWQKGRQMTQMTNGNTTAMYMYNGDGGRYCKMVDGVTTQYYIVDGVTYAEKTGNNTLVYLYDEAGVPYALKYNGVIYYYYYNPLGDVVGLIDSTGTLVVTYTYNPWGKLISTTDTTSVGIGTINPLRYRGYYYDAETGFYYLGSRYYDPEIGRFINADGEIAGVGNIQGNNLFQYCFNNPVNMSDPTGNWPNWGKLFSGASLMSVGVMALATVATVVTGGVASPFMVVAASVTFTAGSAAVVMGTSEIQESFTGVNPVKETVFKGDDKKYQKARNVVETTSSTGSMITSAAGVATKIAQETGKVAFKVPVNNLVNNQRDEFVTVSPKQGAVADYCRSIPTKGYGEIYVTGPSYSLRGPIYTVVGGNHRFAALQSLGETTIKVFFTK